MIVVYVHGNGNKVRAELLKLQWDLALFGRDVGDDSRMAYWAPLLHPEPLPDPEFDEIGQPTSPALESTEVHETPETLVTAAVEATDGELPGELEAYAREMAYTAEALVEGEELDQAGDGVTPEALPLPRAARIRIFEQLVRVTFKDVHAYFFRGFAERMRAVVRATIADIDEPFILVAHSLGTVIAYDVLREEASRSLQVPLLITVGSPLGVREIQDLVANPLGVPSGVGAWLNASDARDIVALDHTLRPEYVPADRITDVMVVNDSANHHGIRDYLAASVVRERVAAALPGDVVALEAVEEALAQEEALNSKHGHLLSALRPVLRYDGRERYFADSATSFVENRFADGPMRTYYTRLLRADGTVVAAADGDLELEFLGARKYADGRPARDDDRLDAGPEPVADARRRHAEPGNADVVYGRVAPRGGGGVWLQWWLFYFHSAKGIPGIRAADGLLGAGLHQGDWELVQLGIPADRLDDPNPEPDVAVLAAHDYAHRIAWEDVDGEPEGGWAVYVGRDSHASFPKAGRWRGKKRGPFSFDVLDDVADGRGASRRPEVQLIRVGDPAWVGWPGLWGSTKSKPVLGGGSPRGPWRQRPWRDPDAFARDASPWTDHHVRAEELVEAVPTAVAPPTVTVGRDGADWTITIALAPGAEEDWAGTLTLVTNGFDGPALRVYDVSRAGVAPSVGEEDA
jgi:hypothetical protein